MLKIKDLLLVKVYKKKQTHTSKRDFSPLSELNRSHRSKNTKGVEGPDPNIRRYTSKYTMNIYRN